MNWTTELILFTLSDLTEMNQHSAVGGAQKTFRVWSADRLQKKAIYCEYDVDVLKRKASEKLGIKGSLLVLEEDGTEIDDNEVLHDMEGKVLQLLSGSEKWRHEGNEQSLQSHALELANVKAEKELAKMEAEKELANVKAEKELAKMEAEKELANVKAEKELAKMEAEMELAKVKAEKELARVKAEKELAEMEAEMELAKVNAEKEFAKIQSETNHALQLVKVNTEKDMQVAMYQLETKKIEAQIRALELYDRRDARNTSVLVGVGSTAAVIVGTAAAVAIAPVAVVGAGVAAVTCGAVGLATSIIGYLENA